MSIGDLFYWLFLLYVVLIISVMILERRKTSTTIAWLLILVTLPYVGFVFYLFFGRDVSRRKVFRVKENEKKEIRRLAGRQLQSLDTGGLTFHDVVSSEYQGLIRMNLKQSNAIFSQDNTVEIITDGKVKFDRLFESIRQARHHIHLEYYIFRNDALGHRLLELLEEKARDGVQVRILIDGVGNKFPSSRLEEARASGVEVAIFFPNRILPYLELLLNHRNHRKIVVIDGEHAYIGGFNIGEEYLGANSRMGYWRDTHLRVTGSAVFDIQSRFILDWRVSSGRDISGDSAFFPETPGTGQVAMQLVASGPENSLEQIKYGFIEMINQASESVDIQTPYFVPDDSLLEAVKIALLRGVRVRIMIPNKPDHIFVYWATYSYIGDLLPFGLEAYTYENGFLHAKTMVVDGKVLTCGTANFDIRSFRLNFEANSFIYNQETAGQYVRIFEEDIMLSRRITLEDYRNRPLAVRMKEPVARLLSPLL